jgi:hypothetical protein
MTAFNGFQCRLLKKINEEKAIRSDGEKFWKKDTIRIRVYAG